MLTVISCAPSASPPDHEEKRRPSSNCLFSYIRCRGILHPHNICACYVKMADAVFITLLLVVWPLQLFKNFFETNTTRDPSKDTAIILTVEGRAFPVHSYFVKR